jgi:hypothetical protein
MGHCCNDPRADTLAASLGRAMLIKGIVLRRLVRWPLRARSSRELFTLLPALFLHHTQERRREEKRGARAIRRAKKISSTSLALLSVILLAAAWARGGGGAQTQRKTIGLAEFRKVTKMAKSVCTFMAAGAVRNRLMSASECVWMSKIRASSSHCRRRDWTRRWKCQAIRK